ncbi:hypothetical protein A2643_03870 [Candidatus Nomurabacteria bacterium RIFCSPHIGHO2_01_FULL_39_220]|uniref:Uncharacterized protein n=1 Tax=Candidatus Nomurabacteria bacterium RIFCSPLOWO2_02_FULL_40_67 TaxID=1801787 RepID=A0A1F6Y5L4_9BACT|nr:MAG: hypothetical protein UU01_C0004G0026 [Parcubacteria group bacterium GW2011_GWA2_40_37]KKS11617.1 MAG: hypothetical protein UU66_C0013G0011 [Parcubacteria group bacterium GW2011_GWB1_41_5]KKS71336.1 MAG: hypothetical protein UV43_C0040G0006 [Parcubacteria group bacterium GW2011_GWF2_42_7]OGI62816.1 MAG: hypothetical protein A2W12_03440 [Candidatus Nomurabacteria bacterium RBG_16_40_11]OGI69743.1 MAG: hypothetical protein A2643_03870 [Candidatus Nomurabacteria bacterium RIFCSPHIGHO2_01_FU
MRKVYILLILGVWVAILPHLGFPYFWKNILTTLSGLGIIYASFVIYKESQIKKTPENKTFDNFLESKFENKVD